MPLMLALVVRERALVPSMALMPLVLDLVVRGGINSMNGIDAAYVGSFGDRWHSFHEGP